MTVTPFPMIERALKELIVQRYPAAEGRLGGDLSFESGDGLYVWYALVGGSSDQIEGEWIVDIDVFGDSYGAAMDAALALEAGLLGKTYARTELMRIDNISQNEVPVERPWDDELVFRIGATYVFTARRTG